MSENQGSEAKEVKEQTAAAGKTTTAPVTQPAGGAGAKSPAPVAADPAKLMQRLAQLEQQAKQKEDEIAALKADAEKALAMAETQVNQARVEATQARAAEKDIRDRLESAIGRGGVPGEYVTPRDKKGNGVHRDITTYQFKVWVPTNESIAPLIDNFVDEGEAKRCFYLARGLDPIRVNVSVVCMEETRKENIVRQYEEKKSPAEVYANIVAQSG